jgi:hypothetical protein
VRDASLCVLFMPAQQTRGMCGGCGGGGGGGGDGGDGGGERFGR